MPEDPPKLSRAAEELTGDLRGIPFREPARMKRRPTKGMAPLVEELLVKYQIGRNSPEQAIRDRWPELVSKSPFGRMATVEEIGALAAFLCSPLSGYTTGTIITVDGGAGSRRA